ncbi:hypothetical protein ElyMa_002484200 [Elysia marginata]|uniref:Uncharacterized protein n=1 Tax=Elysia marginata TaxID=1093978 RepID=A0AAV4GPV6_9GAST|nr:hypothetical protein ElyMa_002484200 [Elysia marginata]
MRDLPFEPLPHIRSLLSPVNQSGFQGWPCSVRWSGDGCRIRTWKVKLPSTGVDSLRLVSVQYELVAKSCTLQSHHHHHQYCN